MASNLPTPTPQLVNVQLTKAEAQVLAALATEALKYNQFEDPGFNPSDATACYTAQQKLVNRLLHRFQPAA